MQTQGRFRLAASMLALSLALSGCVWDGDYQRPVLSVPSGYSGEAPVAATVPDDWWRDFKDADLDALVVRALERNNDLTVAVEKLTQARLKAGLAQGDLYPSLSASGTLSRKRTLSDPRKTTRGAETTASLTFDPDPWGALSRTRDAADLEATASALDLADTAQGLAATTTELYWKLVYMRQRVALSVDSIAYARRTYTLTQARHVAGAVSTLDVLEAEQNLRSLEAEGTTYRQTLTETENALAILFDAPPSKASVPRQTLPAMDPPPVASGLPAQVLERRADIRAVEARLAATLATTDATRSGFLPSFSLTGSLGGSSVALTDVLKNPIGALGAGISLPFLNWREMRRTIKVSESEYRAAVADFRQTLYMALADVENALSERRQLALKGDYLVRSLETAVEAERLYEVRYRAGAVTLQSWLDAQEKRRTAEESLLVNRYDRLVNRVVLYRALGGGVTLPAGRQVDTE
ncbi:MAG: efflux transporter outer membrane subunit [Rhodospirillaceae bacterium]|nr:efflux transporter outer membrane subunit [Rhodospirillaceae bacterium]